MVATSEVKGLYYCMCTCKWRGLWSLLQKFRDCITAYVHANGSGCGRYFRSSWNVLLNVYMQMEVAVVSTSEVRDCITACVHANGGGCGLYFRSSGTITACVHANGGSCGRYFRRLGTVLLHEYMQMEVAVVSTSEVQELY